MKELSIEEKAKAYDKAIEIAKGLYAKDAPDSLHLERMFPVLAESEDERIRKDIISHFAKGIEGSSFDEVREKYKIWIAWLEKQGEQKLTPIFRIGDTIIAKDGTYIEKEPFHIDRIEDDCYWDGKNTILVCNQDEFEIFKQKPANKVEPKFKVGDWVFIEQVDNIINGPHKIKEVSDYGYVLDGIREIILPFTSEHCMYLWTIQDAKDGDVLAAHECLVLFKEIDGLNIKCYCTYHFLNHEKFFVDTLQNKTAFTPATKEQRDTLMKAMADAGYTFYFEKKELRKIEQTPVNNQFTQKQAGVLDKHIDKFLEQKSAWSEEDEKMLDEMYEFFDKHKIPSLKHNMDDYVKFIKSIKERVKPHNRWKPSDEQMDALHTYIYNPQYFSSPDTRMELVESVYRDLKKLREE